MATIDVRPMSEGRDASSPNSRAPGLRSAETGERIRSFRQFRQLTLRRVAEEARITESYLSQIERGSATGSIDTLDRIATALGMTLSDLFSSEPVAHRVLKRDERPAIVSEGVTKYLLTQRPLRSLEVMEAILWPGASVGDATHTHGRSQELLIALEGSVRCMVDGADYDLDAGDSIEYSSAVSHSATNPFELVARVLYVISPPSI